MVQVYTQAHSSHPSGWSPFTGGGKGIAAGTGMPARTCSHSGHSLYDQWASHSAEEPQLRRVGEVRGEAGGAMLTISGLKNFYHRSAVRV